MKGGPILNFIIYGLFAFWLRKELRESLCPSVHVSGTKLSRAVNLHLSKWSTQRALREPSESYSQSLKYCVLLKLDVKMERLSVTFMFISMGAHRYKVYFPMFMIQWFGVKGQRKYWRWLHQTIWALICGRSKQYCHAFSSGC